MATLVMSANVFANGQETIKIWPEGAPNSNGMTVSPEDSVELRIVNEPLLHIFPSENHSGKVVLMCPGGGYRHLAMDHEGFAFAPWYNRQGIDVAVLQYRMPNGHDDVPLSDVHQSMRILRERYPDSKIGIQGFSAGGHLASTAATHYEDAATRPDFQILFYPVITVTGDNAHPGSSRQLLGENPPQQKADRYNNQLQVTSDTPQAFILHSSDDKVVPVSNSFDYCNALVANNVPVTLHVYPVGGHGWGFYEGFLYKPQWTAELEYWLSHLKF